MGLIHTRASKKRDKQEAKLLREQRHQAKGTGDARWEQVLAAIESGEVTWADVGRLDKMSMPLGYQMRCKAADRRNRKEN
jgi:hypothetical protein